MIKKRWFLITKGIILGLIILSIASGLCAQSAIDSLQNKIKTAQGIKKAELLLELSSHTRQKDLHKAITQVQEALSIAKRSGDEELQSASLSTLAWFYSSVEKDTTALKYYLDALLIERQHGHRLAEALILYDLGRFYAGQGNQPKALSYFFQALRIYKEQGKFSDASETLTYIGGVYADRGDLKQAISFYEESYALGKKVKSYNEMTFAASATAYAYKDLKKYDEAIRSFNKALAAARNINSEHKIHAIASIMLGMSSVYKDQKLYKQAIALTNKQLALAKSNESRMLQAFGYDNLGKLFQDQRNFERSNIYFKKAISLWEALGLSDAGTLNELAKNFIKQKKYTKAVQTTRRGLERVDKSGSIQQKNALLKTLLEAYRKQGAYQKAVQVQNELIAVNKEIYNRTKGRQIAELQTRYKTAQKEQEIALLQKEQEKAELLRNALLVGLALIIVIGFLIYNRQRLKIRKNRTDIENTRLKRDQLEQDIAFKNKQLTTHSLHLVQKNEVMKELQEKVSDLRKHSNGKSNKKLNNLKYLVDYSFNLDEDWENFRHYFEEVHTGFFDRLKKQYPDLTTNELRLSALVKLNLSIKEISTILSISPDSVKTARYRLRKKLGMETEENLTDFMMNIEKDIRV